MSNNDVTAETKILKAANTEFLLYGYHGTKLHQIAKKAGVNKSAIHYYYRSKEILYSKVVILILNDILKISDNFNGKNEISDNQKWFLSTELYNNQNSFEIVIKELFVADWVEKLIELKKILDT